MKKNVDFTKIVHIDGKKDIAEAARKLHELNVVANQNNLICCFWELDDTNFG